mgnify:CR=1 FL=1
MRILGQELLDAAERIVGRTKGICAVSIQLAVGCVNDALTYLYEPLRPAMLRSLRQIVEMARKRGIPVSMCGAMVAFLDWAQLTMNNPGELA